VKASGRGLPASSRRPRRQSPCRSLTTAVLVNPTQTAPSRFVNRKEEGWAPRCSPRAKGDLAEVIRDIARANGINPLEDIPLARMLHSACAWALHFFRRGRSRPSRPCWPTSTLKSAAKERFDMKFVPTVSWSVGFP